jgi:hypothetical protein
MTTALASNMRRAAPIFQQEIFMRRATVLCAAAIAVSAFAAVSPAQAGYYLIRYDNTGVCQLWNESLTMKPMHWPSDYKVVSKPVATVTDALAVKETLRQQGRCTW